MPASPSLADLRQLLAARFPTAARKAESLVPTGVASLDHALEGGLPGGALTELVCGPSTGSGLVLTRLIASTRKARQRIVLLDAADGFSPEDEAPEILEHIVWCRCGGVDLSALWLVADLTLRDSHFAAAVIDLRGVPERALLRTPGSTWYRLQRAVEQSSVATLVLSPTPVVPSVRHRFRLAAPHHAPDLRMEREHLLHSLAPEHERARGAFHLSA